MILQSLHFIKLLVAEHNSHLMAICFSFAFDCECSAARPSEATRWRRASYAEANGSVKLRDLKYFGGQPSVSTDN